MIEKIGKQPPLKLKSAEYNRPDITHQNSARYHPPTRKSRAGLGRLGASGWAQKGINREIFDWFNKMKPNLEIIINVIEFN